MIYVAIAITIALTTAILVVLAIATMLSIAILLQVCAMDSDRLEVVPRPDDEDLLTLATDHHDFATRSGYTWLGAYTMRPLENVAILAWQTPDEQDYFLVYRTMLGNARRNLTSFCFVTIFDRQRGHALATVSATTSMLLPPAPGMFKQCFPKAGPEELRRHHDDARAYLEANGLHESFDDAPFEDVILEGTRRELRHTRSIPLWFIRAPWWYARRGRHAGRSVQDRYPPQKVADAIRHEIPVVSVSI